MNNHPAIFIILGATGDLAMRKLFPALFELWSKKMLPATRIVGYARRPFTDEEFRSLVSKEAGLLDADFLSIISYAQGNFDSKEAYIKLGHKLGDIDQELGVCAHKFFHLSISPVFYEVVLKQMDEAGLSLSCVQGGGVTKLLMEKPIGFDEKSAISVIDETERIFAPEQIHRIDHYLMKDHLYTALSNLSGKAKQSIQIDLFEKLDIQGRGQFYDSVGALRDVAQNHALEMLSLTIASDPHSPESRAEALSSVTVEKVELGQYSGYLNEEHVSSDSKTETYFDIQGAAQGVSFRIRGGKALGSTVANVTVDGVSHVLSQPKAELGAYARMYNDTYVGENQRFVSKGEILSSWKIIDKAREMAKVSDLRIYDKGWTPNA